MKVETGSIIPLLSTNINWKLLSQVTEIGASTSFRPYFDLLQNWFGIPKSEALNTINVVFLYKGILPRPVVNKIRHVLDITPNHDWTLISGSLKKYKRAIILLMEESSSQEQRDLGKALKDYFIVNYCEIIDDYKEIVAPNKSIYLKPK